MRRLNCIVKQNSKWEITTKHYFSKRLYQVDENGNFYRDGKIVFVKPDKSKSLMVLLMDDNNERVRCKIHQIVFQAYNENSIKDYYSVDHINRNRLDNRICNLRLADRETQCMNRENTIYKFKKILCKNNGIIYNSCKEAENILSLIKNTVSRVARGERKSIHGYSFDFI